MMRFISALFSMAFFAFALSPYVNLYLLSKALESNDGAGMETYINLQAIRDNNKISIQQQAESLQKMVAPDSGNTLFGSLVRDVSGIAVDNMLTMDSVREALRPPVPSNEYPSLFSNTSFAFFESPTRFQVRIGELGQGPTHFYMRLEDWTWRVYAIYK